MNLFERCKKLNIANAIIENETTLPIYFPTKNDITTVPEIASIRDNEIEFFCKQVYYISDIHIVHKVLRKFQNKVANEQIEQYIKQIAEGLLTSNIKDSISLGKELIILFGGDVSSDFEVAKIFFTEFMNILKKRLNGNTHSRCYVFAVLGNHEFWSFSSPNDCYEAYKELFESIGIIFLNNNIAWFGNHDIPLKRIQDESGSILHFEKLNREDDEIEYDRQMQYIHNTIIVGGVGFSGCNQFFNADTGIYGQSLTRKAEIEETDRWLYTYLKALQYAKENNCTLIVLTHMPICDWKKDGLANSNSIYFNGHNHRNDLQHDDERNIHIFSDNQIGYYNSKIQLKEAYIYPRVNPFAMHLDGYHEVSSNDYLRFYTFVRDSLHGNGVIEKHLKKHNGHLYMIKHKGYYGFFLQSNYGTYICAGGTIKKLSTNHIIELVNEKFLLVIQKYISILSPYRHIQEQISETVKAFGGDGTIHGSIINIDFYNHIMLNPNDGSVIYYHSPICGLIKKYDSILSLLENHNEFLAEQYRNKITTKSSTVLEKRQSNISNDYIKVDKKIVYSDSRRLNQLQRLFSKRILRDWNENLLSTEKDLIE